jgi:2-oxo-3-hexenedioate decarboxylase
MESAPTQRPARIAEELIALLGTAEQVEPFSRRYPGFDLAEAYEVVAQLRHLRSARGEHPVGRKIGFTNRAVWRDYEVSAPIWGFVFNRTVSKASAGEAYELVAMPEPRIEPEIALHLASAPASGMNIDDLVACIDWVAPAFEVVYSIFPNWQFTGADAAAAYGVHGALVLGEELSLIGSGSKHAAELATFSVEMENNRGVRREGHAQNVLGGPLEALKFLVEEIARYPICEPLRAGEIVTTGTLTEAMPAVPGDEWTARFDGMELKPVHLHFRKS